MNKSTRVYSTDKGRLCPSCTEALSACRCASDAANKLVGDGRVRVKLDTKSRNGKAVTLVEGLAMTVAEVETLAKVLKTRCSSGGAVKNGVIEIQGDHRTLILSVLQSKGIQAKQAGG
jgi:translation initiation factor 1